MPSLPLFSLDGATPDFANATNQAASLSDSHFTNIMERMVHYPGLDIRSSGLGNYSSVNASAVQSMHQRYVIQVLATTTSSISLLAASCAIYWFCMMRRNFRRDLVLLLIIGGMFKSFVFTLFGAVTFANGPVSTDGAVCQASGYMLQLAFELCGEYERGESSC